MTAHIMTANAGKTENEGVAASFADRVASLRERAMTEEGKFRQAITCLSTAEKLERQAGLYRIQIDAIKRQGTLNNNRVGVRISHLHHGVKRLLRQRDQYLAMADAALHSTP